MGTRLFRITSLTFRQPPAGAGPAPSGADSDAGAAAAGRGDGAGSTKTGSGAGAGASATTCGARRGAGLSRRGEAFGRSATRLRSGAGAATAGGSFSPCSRADITCIPVDAGASSNAEEEPTNSRSRASASSTGAEEPPQAASTTVNTAATRIRMESLLVMLLHTPNWHTGSGIDPKSQSPPPRGSMLSSAAVRPGSPAFTSPVFLHTRRPSRSIRNVVGTPMTLKLGMTR